MKNSLLDSIPNSIPNAKPSTKPGTTEFQRKFAGFHSVVSSKEAPLQNPINLPMEEIADTLVRSFSEALGNAGRLEQILKNVEESQRKETNLQHEQLISALTSLSSSTDSLVKVCGDVQDALLIQTEGQEKLYRSVEVLSALIADNSNVLSGLKPVSSSAPVEKASPPFFHPSFERANSSTSSVSQAVEIPVKKEKVSDSKTAKDQWAYVRMLKLKDLRGLRSYMTSHNLDTFRDLKQLEAHLLAQGKSLPEPD